MSQNGRSRSLKVDGPEIFSLHINNVLPKPKFELKLKSVPSWPRTDFQRTKHEKVRSIQYIEINFLSNSELSQNFRSKKVSHLGISPRDRDF